MSVSSKELILQAFEKARSSGKDDWHRMTTAVLKNRLLQLTQGAFREADYAVKSIHELIEQNSDILRIDRSHYPPTVELISGHVIEDSHAPPNATFDRIRPDLWLAIMDYASGNQYIWDPVKGTARSRQLEDSAEYLLPTISPEIDAAWRKEFAAKIAADLSEPAKKRFEAFVTRTISPRVLPRAILVKWNEFLKARILQTLSKWFEDHHVAAPEKLLVSVRRPPRIVEDEVEQLRNLIVACVKGMTPQELATINLPPLVLLRTKRGKGA